MNNFSIPVLLAAATCLSACSSATDPPGETVNRGPGLWQNAQPSPVRLVHEQTFADDESEPRGLLGGAFYATPDSSGNLYVLSIFEGRLVSFNPEGKLRWEVEAPGRGPAELRSPDRLFVDPAGRLVFSNQFAERIDRFDSSGTHQGSIPLESSGIGSGNLVGVLPDGSLVIRRGAAGIAGARLTIAQDEIVLDTFSVDLSEGMSAPGGLSVPAPVSVYKGHVALKHLARYAYSFYSPEGNHLRTVSREMPFQAPVIREITGGVQVTNWSLMYGPYPLPEGRWIGGGTWPTDMGDPEEYMRLRDRGEAPDLTYVHTLDLFDADGVLLYSVEKDTLDALGIASILAADSDGKLYARLVSGPYVGRFRLEVTPPR